MKNYASCCGGCLCNICKKSAGISYKQTLKERQNADCYRCEDCWYYGNEVGKKRLYTETCNEFKIIDSAAIGIRRKLKVVRRSDDERTKAD